MATTALTKVLKMRDANGWPYVQPDPTVSPIGTLLGRPIVENASLAAVASATKSVAFGDFRDYHVVRLPLRLEMSRDYKCSTDQVALKVVERIDGKLVGAGIKTMVSDDT